MYIGTRTIAGIEFFAATSIRNRCTKLCPTKTAKVLDRTAAKVKCIFAVFRASNTTEHHKNVIIYSFFSRKIESKYVLKIRHNTVGQHNVSIIFVGTSVNPGIPTGIQSDFLS